VSPEYFQDPESTKKNKMYGANGEIWHRFGDAGYLDERGRLWYCGRVSQRVKGAAGPLFPLNVEPIFDAHPAVYRSGLVGIPNADGTHTPVICIELEPDAPSDHDAIRKELLELAGKHRTTTQIKTVLFKNKLPVDPRHNSKIERPALSKWAAANMPR
jgi:acyl-coenzyme A synthetase/AMP-(fatty) acid ligase